MPMNILNGVLAAMSAFTFVLSGANGIDNLSEKRRKRALADFIVAFAALVCTAFFIYCLAMGARP